MTDYEQLENLLAQLGGVLVEEVPDLLPQDDDTEILAQFWKLPNNKSFIALVNQETDQIGLYSFVGKDGDEIEKDLAFVRELAGVTT